MLDPHLSRRQWLSGVSLLLAYKTVAAEDSIETPDAQDSISETALPSWQELAAAGHVFEHWTPEQDAQWQWYRLERYLAEKWETVGISLPVDRESGEPFEPAEGYLSLSQVPTYVREGTLPELPGHLQASMPPTRFDPQAEEVRQPDPDAQARDGRPPTDWLVSLRAGELRSWLPTIDVTEAGVSGMTCWVHLIRDHSFDPRMIEGLTAPELTLLHSAAHAGY